MPPGHPAHLRSPDGVGAAAWYSPAAHVDTAAQPAAPPPAANEPAGHAGHSPPLKSSAGCAVPGRHGLQARSLDAVGATPAKVPGPHAVVGLHCGWLAPSCHPLSPSHAPHSRSFASPLLTVT